MADSRTKNATRNLIWTVLRMSAGILFPFIFRTLILKEIGEAVLGVTTLYKSLIQVLNITELGLESAIGASLYKPIADNDENKICALLALYRRLYFIIAAVIFTCGMILIPFLRPISHNSLPTEASPYLLWVMFLIDAVIGYILFAYDMALIQAHQRKDLLDKVELSIRMVQYVLQYFAIVFIHSIIVYELLKIGYTLCLNIGCKIVSKKRYGTLVPRGMLDVKTKNKVFDGIKAMAFQKIGNTMAASVDTVIISSFMGLSIVAIYGNYNMVIFAVSQLLVSSGASIVASVGNSIVTSDTKKTYEIFKTIVFMQNWIAGWCSICFICLFQDFIVLWVGREMQFEIAIVLTLIFRFYFDRIRDVVLIYKDALGLWQPDRWRPIVACVVNLFLNLLLINFWGIAGIAIATIIVFVAIELPWETKVLFDYYFKSSSREYYIELLNGGILMLICGGVTWKLCSLVTQTGITNMLIKIIICIVIPNILFVLMNCKNRNLYGVMELLLRIVKRKI